MWIFRWTKYRVNFRFVFYNFLFLRSAGVPSPAAHLFSNHYNQTRSEYYRQLDRASKSGGEIVPFIQYAVQGFVDGLREQLDTIRTQQWSVFWRDFVHEKFRNQNSQAAIRRRHLALDLGERAEWVEVGKIAELSPRLAAAYAGKTTKSMHRDILALAEMKLVTCEGKKVRARRELVLFFLPAALKSPLTDRGVSCGK